MFRKVINLALVLVMVLTSSGIALAKADDGPQTPQAAARGQAKSFIVVLTQDPVATYEGEITGYQATKPGKGGKINPNSAHVRKYEKFLEKQQKDVLAAAEVSPAAQVNSYTFTLNGFSAVLSEAEVKALKSQPEALLVMEDQMRYPQTDSSPAFLGLTDAGEFDSARDDNDHGTHTASTAAGNASVQASLYGMPLGTVSGIAPRAHIIACKGLGALGGFTSDLAPAW